MLVQINKIPNANVPEDFSQYVQMVVDRAMNRFTNQLTRVEVHFLDTNGNKAGADDKRCSLEARVAGHEPVAAVHHAESYELALDGAVDKLMSALDHTLGRLNRH